MLSSLSHWLVKVHMNAAADNAVEGELSLAFLKKYLGYCRFVTLTSDHLIVPFLSNVVGISGPTLTIIKKINIITIGLDVAQG